MMNALDKSLLNKKPDKLQCGFCKQRFPYDVSVSVLIDHLCKKHRIRTFAEFCFMQAFIGVHEGKSKIQLSEEIKKK